MSSSGDKPLTRILARRVPGGSRVKGRAYHLDGAVIRIDGTPWAVHAIVRGSRPYVVDIQRDAADAFSASCDCPYFHDRFVICKHIWAALLEAERREYLLGDGDLSEDATIDPVDRGGVSDPAFETPAEAARRVARATTRRAGRPRPWEKFLQDFSRNLAQAERAPTLPRFADSQIVYVIDRAATIAGETLALDLQSRQRKKTGDWGRPKPAPVGSADLGQLPDRADREIVPLLLGASDPHGGLGHFARGSFRLPAPLVERVLPIIAQSGRAILRVQPSPGEQLVPLVWDDGPPWTFRLEIVHASGDEGFSIDGALVRGSERLAIRAPWLVLAGFIIHADRIARLDPRGAFTWLAQLRGTGPIVIPAGATGQLLDVLARSGVDPTDLPEELQFEIVTESPRPSLSVRADTRVSAASVAASLQAMVTFDYGGHIVQPGTGATTFDPGRRLLIRRDIAQETAAINRLTQLGFWRQWDVEYARQHLAITTARFPFVVRELVSEGWRVEAEGRAFRSVESMRSDVRSGIDWFELHGSVDFGENQVVPLPRLLDAFRHGRTTLTLDDGTTGIVPEEWLRSWAGIAGVGETTGDHVRFKMSQVALLDAALALQPAVRVDERFARTRDELASFQGITALDPASSFAGQLRDYQRDALGWFAFLKRFGFGGCLADDMGLGKTVMVLAWLDRLRAMKQARAPSLVVVPRSVVFNWKEEAARFAPKLRVLDFSGASRSVGRLDGHDIILTSYGTLRRDALILKDVEFEYAILDEAQTIKNANTAAAKAARLIRSKHRLALSGTPVENHLGELWSLFEFLNPGLLGTSSAFARHRGAAAKQDRAAIEVLARGIRPFVLRRTKAQVAPELPVRTELTMHCDMQGLQRELYDELRNHYRTALLGRIEKDGLQKSKMHILEALLRLRQAACHPALIDPRHKDVPSAKFDALLPHLAEVREEGHKALVFSQFTSLLALLRTRLDASGTQYAYLDGRTRDRQAVVEQFQTDPACDVFLISLKAGGLGLNLTAAEYVYLLDPWWNPAVEAQAIDRAHRIGQSRQVFAYRLLATGTVEEKIAELQKSKRELADAIVQADVGLLRNLQQEDLEILLS
ncbi:MAG TPA: DEAD/DEAH box helicase [Vicinamibacterales bacterium]|nr:DEAD/DEAH box helicase [Vicinamibacterales bacterium]